MTAIKSVCDGRYRASRTSGTRPVSDIKWVVVHSTEGGTALSVAQMFHRSDARASTHLVVDQFDCYRMLNDTDIPWGAPGANRNGYHIEICGYSRWSRVVWLAHDPTLRRGAYKAAQRCVRYGIPVRWVGPLGLRLGRKGLTTHADVTKWQKTYGGHTDPGANFPKDVFLSYVKLYVKELLAGRL